MTRGVVGLVYAALWVATLAGAALVQVGVVLRPVRPPRPSLEPGLGTVVELLGHNALVALWPVALVAIGWPALAGARQLGDVLIGTQLLAHGLLVGSALGQHPALWRFLPHLPLEWLGLAAPAAAWYAARVNAGHADDDVVGVVHVTCIVLVALAAAAVIETYLTPHAGTT